MSVDAPALFFGYSFPIKAGSEHAKRGDVPTRGYNGRAVTRSWTLLLLDLPILEIHREHVVRLIFPLEDVPQPAVTPDPTEGVVTRTCPVHLLPLCDADCFPVVENESFGQTNLEVIVQVLVSVPHGTFSRGDYLYLLLPSNTAPTVCRGSQALPVVPDSPLGMLLRQEHPVQAGAEGKSGCNAEVVIYVYPLEKSLQQSIVIDSHSGPVLIRSSI